MAKSRNTVPYSVITQPQKITPTVATLSNIGDTVVLDVTTVSNVVFHCKGTFTTANSVFEGSVDGGETYFAIQAIRSSSNTIENQTGNLSAVPTYAWEASVNAYTHFRIRQTAIASGAVIWTIAPGTYATEPIPGAQIPNGNVNTIVVGTSSGTASGVASSASSVTIAASSTNRKGMIIHNNSTAILYIRYGTPASIASGGYTAKIAADGYWEMPQTIYTGAITGIWAAANGYANVTSMG